MSNLATGVALGMSARQREKECIVVEDKKYCETNNLALKDMGIGLLVCLVILGYLFVAIGFIIEERVLIGIVMLVSPPILMIIFG